MRGKYCCPDFLKEQCSEKAYLRWLHRKATTHVRRDRRRRNQSATVSEYKRAIHEAVENGANCDPYTGKRLDWTLISKYNNKEAKRGGRRYKKQFANLPTVDHVGDGGRKPKFRICSWQTNDAKSDLTDAEFLRLCKAVVSHRKKQKKTTSSLHAAGRLMRSSCPAT
jgi:hypothetical protein